MSSIQDVSHESDWLSTPMASLAPVEAGLRCEICREWLETPMITHCSHTFCSRCIRRCLANDGKCPTCRCSSQENQLRSNWAVEELVTSFKVARPTLLKVAMTEEPPAKRRKLRSSNELDEQERRPRRSTRRSGRIASVANTTSSSQETEATVTSDQEDAADQSFSPDDGLVSCPMCNVRMAEAAVFTHLDRCTGEAPRQVGSPKDAVIAVPNRHAAKPQNGMKPLPLLSYGLLKDAQLKKKLSELGLPSHGSRSVLEARHREWVVIYNSNCDSSRPKGRHELLQSLNAWERTQTTRSNPSFGLPSNDIRSKEFDREAYSEKQKSHFDELIANARRKVTPTETSRADVETPSAEQSAPGASITLVGSADNGRETSSKVGGTSEVTEGTTSPLETVDLVNPAESPKLASTIRVAGADGLDAMSDVKVNMPG